MFNVLTKFQNRRSPFSTGKAKEVKDAGFNRTPAKTKNYLVTFIVELTTSNVPTLENILKIISKENGVNL